MRRLWRTKVILILLLPLVSNIWSSLAFDLQDEKTAVPEDKSLRSSLAYPAQSHR